MNFDIDDEQQSFAEHAQKFFAEYAGPAAARDLLDGKTEPAPGIELLTEFGFSSLTIPEDSGGVGAELLNMALVAEQAGRHLAAPSLATAARTTVLLEGQTELLTDVADGKITVAVLDGSPNASRPSMDVTSASHFLAMEDNQLVLGTGTVMAGDPIDATRGLGTVRLDTKQILKTDVSELWNSATLVACTILAAEGLGGADRANELAIEHAKNRETFGRPIGANQSIKHRLVDDWVAINQLRSLVWWAAWAADHDSEQFTVAASAAKAHAATTFETASETLINVMGGMGFTWEHDAHLYWRRSKVDRLVLGDENHHLLNVAQESLAKRIHHDSTKGIVPSLGS